MKHSGNANASHDKRLEELECAIFDLHPPAVEKSINWLVEQEVQ